MDKYSYEDLLEIVKALRGENGCPWDKVQTHNSLRPCMMEEAAEVLAAIRIYEQTSDSDNLKEELGDVLFQVVMHSCIAEEEKLFTMEDVVSGIAEKMVRRHPHVFSLATVKDSDEVVQNWEEIKKQEKQGKDEKKFAKGPLSEIPLELPALTRTTKVHKKAKGLYSDSLDYETVVNRLKMYVEKLSVTTPENYSEEMSGIIGDMLMDICLLSSMYKLSPEQILTDKLQDWIDVLESH